MSYSNLAYRWLPAENWPRPTGAGIRAIAIHHAEGGGTAGWLTHEDGNSSHYVVEYTGRIVAQVHEERAAGSMKASLTRKDDDPPFTFLGEVVTYGRTALNKALGSYATNPNAAIIAIEVEGFAKDGPNAAQRAALAKLVADIRDRRGPLPCIGHRDQQSYKACPGKRIPWIDYGGHAVRTAFGGADVPLEFANDTPKRVTIPANTPILRSNGTPLKTVDQVLVKDSPLGVYLDGAGYRVIEALDGEVPVVALVKSSLVESAVIEPPVVGDSALQAELAEKAALVTDLSAQLAAANDELAVARPLAQKTREFLPALKKFLAG